MVLTIEQDKESFDMKTNNFFVIITIVMMLLFVGCQYSVNTTINYPPANEAGATGDDK